MELEQHLIAQIHEMEQNLLHQAQEQILRYTNQLRAAVTSRFESSYDQTIEECQNLDSRSRQLSVNIRKIDKMISAMNSVGSDIDM